MSRCCPVYVSSAPDQPLPPLQPIVISHRKSLSNFMANFNLEGFTTLPVYHNHGHSCLWRAVS